MTKGGVKKRIWGGIGLLLTVAAWVLFAPTQIGGAVSYTVISGSSMEPSLYEGDLAITREKSSYDPGDVVAYHNPELDSVVLHRIVRVEDGRLVVKGDNNDFLDTDKPLASDVIGEQWIRIPGAGGFVQKVREPAVAATLVALLSATALGLFSFTRSRRPRHAGSRDKSQGLAGTLVDMMPSGGAAEKTVAGVALAAACLVALAVFAYTRPTTKTVVDKISFEHSGTFAYSADAPRGPVYSDGRVDTGDPVFLRVVDNIRVSFDYEFATEAEHSLTGDGRLVAELSDTNGWMQTFVIDSGAIEGDRLQLAGDLDLAEMRVLTQHIEKLTGITRDAYALSVVPQISVEGNVAGRPLVESFSSPATFRLDALQLSFDSEGAAGEPLRPTSEGFVDEVETAPVGVVVLGVDLSVSALRRIGVVGAILALTALALLARPLRTRERDEVARILTRYASRLVPVARMPRSLDDAIPVADMDTLVRLAEGYQRAILHVVHGQQHTFVVEDAGTTYVYSARAATSLAGAIEPREAGLESPEMSEAYSTTESGPGGPRRSKLV